jgi:hypothetical protein
MSARRVLLLFIDGVGLGDDGPHNPFTRASLPALRALLGGALPLRSAAGRGAAGVSLHALDATLGVAGLPQSGTGQAALFTGENAAARHGRHFGPWVPTTVRPQLAESNVLVRAQRAGRSVAFANAYPEELVARATDTTRRVPAYLRAGPPLVALAAGVLTRHTAELARGDAVASEITNDGWRQRLKRAVPAISPAAAGAHLAHIVAQHDLTLFAHYATDTAGHLRELAPAVAALEKVDAFVRGIVDHLPSDATIVIASDHGNIEDVRVQHTRNPALGMVIGAEAEGVALHAITDVAPLVLRLLNV